MEISLLSIAILLAVSYLIGSLNAAKILTNVLKKGPDISTLGTKNAGAWNAWMQFGRGYGLLVFGFDAAKGAAVVLASRALGFETITTFYALTLVIIGHNWPAFFRFRGGKGFATLIGSLFAFNPMGTLVATAPTFISIFLRYSGLSPFIFLWTAILWGYYKTEMNYSLLIAAGGLTIFLAAKKLQTEWKDIQASPSKSTALINLLIFDRVGRRKAPSLDEILFRKKKGGET